MEFTDFRLLRRRSQERFVPQTLTNRNLCQKDQFLAPQFWLWRLHSKSGRMFKDHSAIATWDRVKFAVEMQILKYMTETQSLLKRRNHGTSLNCRGGRRW